MGGVLGFSERKIYIYHCRLSYCAKNGTFIMIGIMISIMIGIMISIMIGIWISLFVALTAAVVGVCGVGICDDVIIRPDRRRSGRQGWPGAIILCAWPIPPMPDGANRRHRSSDILDWLACYC